MQQFFYDQRAVSETERIVKALQKCNGNITFTRLQHEGHGIEFL